MPGDSECAGDARLGLDAGCGCGCEAEASLSDSRRCSSFVYVAYCLPPPPSKPLHDEGINNKRRAENEKMILGERGIPL